jgi:hypothetical protein
MIAEGKSEYEFVFARNAAASSEIHIEVQRHGERLHTGELSAE